MASALTTGQGRSAQAGKTLTVDLEALFLELRAAGREEGEGVTGPELQELLGRGAHYVRDLIKAAKAAKRCRVERVYREAIDGVQRPVPGYVFE